MQLEAGDRLQARKLLIATGVSDQLPAIEGFEACYGRSVHHCPYCDGWEWRDAPLAVLGSGKAGAALALALLTWSADVQLFTNGPARLPPPVRQQLTTHGIAVHDGAGHRPRARRTAGSTPCGCRTGTPSRAARCSSRPGQHQQESFASQLGCEFTRKGTVKTDRYGQTCVPGVFVVGDASFDVQFVVVAAAEGAKAAVLINKQFQSEAGQALA